MKNYVRTDFSPIKKIVDNRRKVNKAKDPIVGVYSTPDCLYNPGELNYWGMAQSRLNSDCEYPYWAINVWLIPGTFSL